MFSHFTLGSNNLARSEKFYSAALAPLDQFLTHTSIDGAMYRYSLSDQSFPHLFIARPFDDLPATWSNGFHIAFNAKDSFAVDQFYAAALANGGIDEGAPGLRPEYEADYYAAYVRDPDGNKLQAVCYTNGRSTGATGEVISHITIGLADFQRERRFYRAVLAVLDIEELGDDDPDSMDFGYKGMDLPVIYVQPTFDGRPATWGNGTHVALTARSREQVDVFHQVALDNGGICDGPPGLRPQYSENYYAAYIRDSVGNKLQAVCREPC